MERLRAQDVVGWIIPISFMAGGGWRAVQSFDRGEVATALLFVVAFLFGLYLAAGLVRRRAAYLEAIRKED